MKVVRLSALRTGSLHPRRCSWYSFLFRGWVAPGRWCCWKD